MPTGTINTTISIAGLNLTGSATRTAEGQISHEVPLPIGEPGILTTRDGNTQGTVTITADNGLLSTGGIVDVFFTGGRRYNQYIGAVSGTNIALSAGGAGDNLPALSATVVVTPVVTIDTDWDGDLVEMITAHSTTRSSVEYMNSTAVLKSVELTANEPWTYVKDYGTSAQITGDPVTHMHVANALSSTVGTHKTALIYDSVT